MNNSEGMWILAFITMIGGVFAGLFKLVSKNGCRIRCMHPNGRTCCDTDCDEGRATAEPFSSKKQSSSSNAPDSSWRRH